MAKAKHGGKREGAGRHYKYGEPTKIIQTSVPVTKEKQFRKLVAAILKQWLKPKK